MKATRLILVLLCALMGVVGAMSWLGGLRPAQAENVTTTLYVGEDDCSAHLPCYNTIQDAVDAAAAGDEILISGGVYTGMNTLNDAPQVVFISKTLTLRGGFSPDYSTRDTAAYTTTIDAEGDGRPMVVKGVIEVTLEGLHLVNGDSTSLGNQWVDMPAGGCKYSSGFGEAGKGGGLCIESGAANQYVTVIVSDTIIENNLSTHTGWPHDEHAFGSGIFGNYSHLTIVNSKIVNNRGNPYWWWHGAVYLWNSTLEMTASIVANNIGGGSSSISDGAVMLGAGSYGTIQNSLIAGNQGDGIIFGDGTQPFIVQDNVIKDNAGRGISWGGCNNCKGLVTVRRNIVSGNNGGIFVGSQGRGTIENNVIVDNKGLDQYGQPGGQGGAVYLQTYNTTAGQELIFRHNTLAHNSGSSGVYVWSGNSIWTNNIIANHAIGVLRGDYTGVAKIWLNNTLFSNNTKDTEGNSIIQNGTVLGEAAFLDDGYHISGMSDAIERGLPNISTGDFDGESRPRPLGTMPDIGADEIGVKILVPFQKIALPVQITWNEVADPYYVTYEQPYLIRFANVSNLPLETLVITDDLPAMLSPEYTWFYPDMQIAQPTAQQVTWSAINAVAPGSFGYINVMSLYDTPEPGQVVVNHATLFGETSEGDVITAEQVVTSTTPLIPPLIIFPGEGELCPTLDNKVNVRGLALPGAILEIYYGYELVYTGTVPVNGQFNVDVAAELEVFGNDLEAAVCVPGDECSILSEPVEIKKAESFFCPQRSTWTGPANIITYTFRDESGAYSTDDWYIPGYYGFSGTTLSLYACNCPESSGYTGVPTNVWVESDGQIYQAAIKAAPWYTFYIGGAHTVIFWALCDQTVISSDGRVLIDPDGYVFDVTKGLGLTVGPSDTVTVTNTIQGVTVTAYVSMPQMGGWTVWPAHLYNQQKNPQVTGPDGYYAFFTPPGDYFVKAEGPDGFQEWRSPVVTVISELVHVNIPYTPYFEGQRALVELTPTGPEPAVVVVSPGAQVTWVLNPPATMSYEKLRQMAVNPLVQVRTSRVNDPLTNILGFDSGKLRPGDAYERGFPVVGTYTYTDGLGHTGTVIVKYQVYLPLVVR